MHVIRQSSWPGADEAAICGTCRPQMAVKCHILSNTCTQCPGCVMYDLHKGTNTCTNTHAHADVTDRTPHAFVHTHTAATQKHTVHTTPKHTVCIVHISVRMYVPLLPILLTGFFHNSYIHTYYHHMVWSCKRLHLWLHLSAVLISWCCCIVHLCCTCVMWAVECSSFVGAWLSCLWSRVLCIACAIFLVVQLISPLAGGQVCLLAPSSAVYTSGQACCASDPCGGRGSATARLIPPGPWHRTLSWKCIYLTCILEVAACTLKWTIPCILVSTVLVQFSPPHPTLPGDDVQPIRSPAGVRGGVHAEQEETRTR